MFDFLAHADWSTSPRKRWVSVARKTDGRWQVDAPVQVGDIEQFLSEVILPSPRNSRRLIGFDFPIGVPESYGRLTGRKNFLDLLKSLGTDDWSRFFEVADRPEQISIKQPFYPYRPGGTTRSHLYEGLGLSAFALLRCCERRTGQRRAACSLFWTLGGQQVGKAAISGWKEVVLPAMQQGVRLWPFEGSLEELAKVEGSVIAETYPGEAYSHIGVRFKLGESKQRQSDRLDKADAILNWAKIGNVDLSVPATSIVADGFGPTKSGEDLFDSFIGLLAMIELVDGRRSEGTAGDPPVNLWEGWILGQQRWLARTVPRPMAASVPSIVRCIVYHYTGDVGL